MPTQKWTPHIGMNLLPIFSPNASPKPSGITYASQINLHRLRKKIMHGVRPIDAEVLPLDQVIAEESPQRRKLLIAHKLGFLQQGRLIFWENDLSNPAKRVLFRNEVERNAPWIFEQGRKEISRATEQLNLAYERFRAGDDVEISELERPLQNAIVPDTIAHREWDYAISNWFSAAAMSSSVLQMLGELIENPVFGKYVLYQMKARAEGGIGPAYSALIALAGAGKKPVLEQAGNIILAQRLGIDINRYGWKHYAGLTLFLLHSSLGKTVTLLDDDNVDSDIIRSIIPKSIAEDLASSFAEFAGLEGAIYELMDGAEEFFEYFYKNDKPPYRREELLAILTKMTPDNSGRPDELTEADIKFLKGQMGVPVPTMFRSMAYLIMDEPSYYDALESFAHDGIWDFFANDILEQLEEQ